MAGLIDAVIQRNVDVSVTGTPTYSLLIALDPGPTTSCSTGQTFVR
jgi:hypothetical protein